MNHFFINILENITEYRNKIVKYMIYERKLYIDKFIIYFYIYFY
jgi:hypothetical protein